MKWIDLSDTLTKEGKKLPVGKVLMFSKVHLKIVRKKNGKVWAKRVFLYRPDEIDVVDKKKV